MGTLLKILALLVAIWLVIAYLKRLGARDDKSTATKTGRMLACHKCGIFVPDDQAIRRENHVYCCHEHATGND